MRIQNKLQIAFISTSILIAASIISISYVSMVRHFEQQEGNRLKANVGHSAKVIDNFMFSRVADFNVLRIILYSLEVLMKLFPNIY